MASPEERWSIFWRFNKKVFDNAYINAGKSPRIKETHIKTAYLILRDIHVFDEVDFCTITELRADIFSAWLKGYRCNISRDINVAIQQLVFWHVSGATIFREFDELIDKECRLDQAWVKFTRDVPGLLGDRVTDMDYRIVVRAGGQILKEDKLNIEGVLDKYFDMSKERQNLILDIIQWKNNLMKNKCEFTTPECNIIYMNVLSRERSKSYMIEKEYTKIVFANVISFTYTNLIRLYMKYAKTRCMVLIFCRARTYDGRKQYFEYPDNFYFYHVAHKDRLIPMTMELASFDRMCPFDVEFIIHDTQYIPYMTQRMSSTGARKITLDGDLLLV